MPLSIDFLPASYGDSIFIEYGDEQKMYRILIDGGTAGTRNAIIEKLEELPEKERHLELLVVTHVDRDHIEGVLSLLERDELPFTVTDIWFNGYHHLIEGLEGMGPDQGERLTQAILDHELDWNMAFEGKAVVIDDQNDLPVKELAGSAKLTLLSPYRKHLHKFVQKWRKDVEDAGLVPGYGGQPYEYEEASAEGLEALGSGRPNVEALNKIEFKEDTAVANGSSIAFIFEYDGKKILFTGDAFPTTVLKSLSALNDNKFKIDLFKLSHHGSRGNTSPELIEKVNCRQYVISTSGSKYPHPSPETIAWIIKRGGKNPKLVFNYTSPENEIWDDESLKEKNNYSTVYPKSEGIRVRF